MTTNLLLQSIINNQNQTDNRLPTIKNLLLTTANREYLIVLPAGTTRYAFKCRGDSGDVTADVRYAWQTGHVAPEDGSSGDPTSNYDVLPLTSEESESVFFEVPTPLYFSSAQAAVMLSIRYWKNS